MRVLLLLVLACPTAAAWSMTVDAPPAALSGESFEVRACVDAPGPVAWKAHLTLEGRTVGGSPRFGAPRDGACATLHVEPQDVAGDAKLLVRARGAEEATWRGVVRLERGPAPDARIVAAYGPPFSGVVLEGHADLGGLVLREGSRAWPLPDAPLEGRVFVGERAPPGETHVALPLALREGNVTLAKGLRVVDVFPVPRLDKGEVATRAGVEVAGRTRILAEPLRVEGDLVAFATPDAGAAPVVGLLDGARREVLVTGYTLTSEDVAAALLRASRRGVAVRVLLEGAPVGGVPEDEAQLLAALPDARVLRSAPGFPARYRTVHAKVVVVDRERVLVATENLHASSYPPLAGTPGTRGYGVVLHNATLARVFAEVFEQDAAEWPDAQPSPAAPSREPRVTIGMAEGKVLLAHGAWNVTPILSPDAPFALLDAMNGTTRSLDVAMLFAEPAWRDGPNPFLDATLAAARRNVTVRVLLDGAAEGERNRKAADLLNAVAAREGLPLVARVDAPERLLHAKMLVMDGRRAYVGSMNWGRAAALENREAGLVLDAPEVAAFFEEAFEKDWTGDAPAAREVPLPGLVAAGALLGVALTLPRPRRRGGRRRRG